jgi:ABC-type molybdenum transport system ATPase subunit/photorepair protein PhrA
MGGTWYKLLSKSEQWRARVVMQIACSIIDSSSVVLIDEADILDGDNRMGLFKMLVHVTKKNALTAIVAMTAASVDKIPGVSKIGGVAYWIENGEAKLV